MSVKKVKKLQLKSDFNKKNPIIKSFFKSVGLSFSNLRLTVCGQWSAGHVIIK